MSLVLVTYDLNTPGQKHVKMLAKIRNYEYKKLSESCYIINTEHSTGDIFEQLEPLIDANDQLYVFSVDGPIASHGPIETRVWLDMYLNG